jgi:hypothetical protein
MVLFRPSLASLALAAALLAVAVPPIAAPSVVHAQEGVDQLDPEPEVSNRDLFDRLLSISGALAVDGPVGIGGAYVTLSPIRYLSIYAGAGGGRNGFRVAGGLRLHYPVGNGSVGIEGGAAGGPMEWRSNDIDPASLDPGVDPADIEVFPTVRYWDFALHLHMALVFDVRFDPGILFRLHLGTEFLTAPDRADRCTGGPNGPGTCTTRGNNPIRPFVQLTVGYAFDL